jgi:outer membrane protein TolC
VAAQPAPQRPAVDPKPAADASNATLDERLNKILGQPGGLSSDQVVERADLVHPELEKKRAQIARAAAEVDRSLVAYFPRLTFIARYTRLSPIDQQSLGPVVAAPGVPQGPIPPGSPLVNVPIQFPSILNQYWLQANLTIPISDYLFRIRQTHGAATRSEEAAEASAIGARRSVALQARKLYFSWVLARLQREVAAQAVEQAKAHVEAAKSLVEAGKSSKTDLLRAEAQLGNAELLLERSRGMAEVTEKQLRILTKDTRDQPYAIAEDLSAARTQSLDQDSSLETRALRTRPELKALDRRLGSLDMQRSAARAGSYPRLEAFGNLYYANPNSRYVPQVERWNSSWDTGLQLTWSPNDFGASSAAARASQAEYDEAQAERSALADSIRTEVQAAAQKLREARLAEQTSARVLSSAEEAYRSTRELYSLGRASMVELIDAQSELLGARLELINARVGVRVGTYELEHALGR